MFNRTTVVLQEKGKRRSGASFRCKQIEIWIGIAFSSMPSLLSLAHYLAVFSGDLEISHVNHNTCMGLYGHPHQQLPTIYMQPQ